MCTAHTILGALTHYSAAEARKIMSLEHKALGYRPPPGSLASDAQAAASKHPVVDASIIDSSVLRDAALSDAVRIESERSKTAPSGGACVTGIDLERIGLGWWLCSALFSDLLTGTAADARKLMSEEHKALGYRPPPGSLAADAQAAAAKRPHIKEPTVDPHILTVAALKDAARIAYVDPSVSQVSFS